MQIGSKVFFFNTHSGKVGIGSRMHDQADRGFKIQTKYQMRVLSEYPRESMDESASRGEQLGYPEKSTFDGTRYRIEYSRKLGLRVGYPEESNFGGIQNQIEYSKESSLRRRFDEAAKYKRRKNSGAHSFQQF